jgi:hypothetical protein
MNPIEIAARFAAYTWFRSQPQNKALGEAEGHRYAAEHYYRYLDLGLVNWGLGRLLAKMIAARELGERIENLSWDQSRCDSVELCDAN